jgi:integrase/recombinase XerD
MTIPDVVEQFITQGVYLRGWSPRTVRTYRQGLAALQRHNPELPTTATLRGFVISLRQRGITPGGVNMYARTVNSFLSWLQEEGHLSDRLRISLLPNPPKPLNTFSDADIRALVAYRPKGLNHTRSRALALTLVDTGVRISEALGLLRAHMDLDNLVLRVLGKGNKERLVPISTECRKVLYRFVTQVAGQYVFATRSGGRMTYRNAHRDLVKMCRAAGVTGAYVHPHSFRHYFASTYIRRGGDIYRLSRCLGHSDISTTSLYLRSMGIDHLRDAHERCSPLVAP